MSTITAPTILIVEETASRRGRFDGWVDGKQIVFSSRTPFLTAARALLKQGVDPAAILVMRHRKTGTDSLRGQIGRVAKFVVKEGPVGPKFARYDPGLMEDGEDEKNEK